MRALHPMTDEERTFSEEWHPLVFEFLHSQRLSEVDFYDVAVFGFISAVQQFVSGATTDVEFIAMAKRSMKDAVLREAEYNSGKRPEPWPWAREEVAMIFRTCPTCGCALDPEERCDCLDEKEEAAPAVTGTTSRTNAYRKFISAPQRSQAREEVLA